MRVSAPSHPLRWAVVGLVGLALIAAPGVASAWTKGNTAPVGGIIGPKTGLVFPTAVAFDNQGRMYVADAVGAVRMYAAGANGDAAPLKTLTGDATGLRQPAGIAFDSAGRMYVTNAQARSVTVYAADWASGNTAPIKTLSGPSSQFMAPFGLAFDSSGKMYVADVRGNAIIVFAADWASGDTAPIKYLGGPNSGISTPTSVTFDASGQMYVTNIQANSVTVYPAKWAGGDVPPTKVLIGADTGLAAPIDLAFDYLGRMNVANLTDADCDKGTLSSVALWPADWAPGNTPPTKVLKGKKTGLECPYGIAFGPTGLMYVSNTEGRSVLRYGTDVTISITGKRTAPTKVTVTGLTSGVAPGASITAYVRMKAPKQKFVPQNSIKLKQGDLARGTFTYPIGKLKAGKAYEVYVVIGSVESRTITVNP